MRSLGGDGQSHGKVSSVLSANQKQQTTLGIVTKGKQNKTENIVVPLYKSIFSSWSLFAVLAHLRGSEEQQGWSGDLKHFCTRNEQVGEVSSA